MKTKKGEQVHAVRMVHENGERIVVCYHKKNGQRQVVFRRRLSSADWRKEFLAIFKDEVLPDADALLVLDTD